MKKNFLNRGQSMVELLVAIGIMIIVVVALVNITTLALSNASFSRNQALATRYAQQGIEQARQLRDTQTESVFFSNGSCTLASETIGSFTRTRTCEYALSVMQVRVDVSWTDAKGSHTSTLQTHLTKWK